VVVHRIGYTLWPASFELSEPGVFLDEAEHLGVDTVEIPFFAARLMANGQVLAPVVRRFEAQMRGRNLEYSTHASMSINLMDVPEALPLHEKIARTSIEITARLGARNMVVHCGTCDSGDPPALEDSYARQRESLSRLGDIASEHEVLICVETIYCRDGKETALPGRLAAELREIGHGSVSAALDYAHSSLQCARTGANLMNEVKALAPLARHLHLNDCFGVSRGMDGSLPAEALAYGSGDLHLPIGWGNLPWDRLMTEPDYPGDLFLNQELHPAYWTALEGDIAEMRRLSDLMLQRDKPDGYRL